MTLSKRSVERRNERINGYRNARDLQFMQWIKSATVDELIRKRDECFVHWQQVAIERELKRREAVR